MATAVLIVSAVRTAIGKAPNGALRYTRPDELAAVIMREAIARAPGVTPGDIDDVVFGCAMPEAEQGLNVARIAWLRAGFPVGASAVTVNRFCASSLEAIAIGANRIAAGEADIVLAGGTESMSMVPMMGNKIAMNPSVFADDNVAIAYGMGITAEKVAEQWKVSREQQDAVALQSHQRALAAIANGEFSEEIAAYALDDHYPDLDARAITTDSRRIDTDEGPRKDTSLEALAKLRPVFRMGGSVTAGNSSQTSDGAGAVLLASEQALKDYNLVPLSTLRALVLERRSSLEPQLAARHQSSGAEPVWHRMAPRV